MVSSHDLIPRLAHLAPKGLMIIAVVYPLGFMMLFIPGLVVLVVSILVPTVAVELVFILATWRHQRLMCVICAEMTPLDGAAAATKQDTDLRRHHNKWYVVPGLAAMALVPALTVWFGLPGQFSQLGTSYALVLISLDTRAWQVHRTLEPWCPYCRRYRRWEDEGRPEPSPDPAPSNETKV